LVLTLSRCSAGTNEFRVSSPRRFPGSLLYDRNLESYS
jgi:hypothetical protein